MNIQIGQKFLKQLNKSKYAECEVVDIINRISQKTKKVVGVEYWAKCTSGDYAFGQTFEVAKNTIIRNIIK